MMSMPVALRGLLVDRYSENDFQLKEQELNYLRVSLEDAEHLFEKTISTKLHVFKLLGKMEGDIKNFQKNEKLDQVVAIVKSCSPNVSGDLTVTMKDLLGAALILANILVFSLKPSMHYLNVTMRNVVKVFRKDTVPGSDGEDLGFKDGMILFSYFRIPGKSLDEGLTLLMSDEDVLSLLKYVPRHREIEVYIEIGFSSVGKQMMEVRLAKGEGVLIKKIAEDDDVESKNEASTSKLEPLGKVCGTSHYGFSDSDSSDQPPWSSECMMEKGNNGGVMNSNNNDGDNEEEETAQLFAELGHLLEHVAFLNVKLREIVVGVDPLVVAVDALIVHVDALVIALGEEIQRPKKRKREMEDESASGVVAFGRPNKRRRLNPAKKTEKGVKGKAMKPNRLGF
uniref:Uncharacterized protein n=1 Tax=Tanacetum cinerariifolium TaxID=118510 RepID=A0A6L2LL77_TANCI|nr:hypothetical protein [Tanacetum cinerariifolium]